MFPPGVYKNSALMERTLFFVDDTDSKMLRLTIALTYYHVADCHGLSCFTGFTFASLRSARLRMR